ncbi:Autoinducer 2 sensor kinase/phosphatase luxQ [Capnocytophaga ochracea]|uniref:histidine kinase n=2 Tax=Capnocytophaga ochracea TaxID=1018 RepID=A0A2X2RXF5_CAPOC|nr:Autoinducer 2 sensor kinase/phosphatase luxQ [Capnocytophaga ochracea]
MSFLRTKILKMKSNKVTLKVIVSYVLLICVSIVAGYVVYKEIQKLSHQEEINQQDRNKIIQISKILTLMNDTESAGRVAIRTDDREALQVFLEKNVTLQNEVLKFRRDITSERQLLTLDTITSLLNLKSENLQELKAFQESDSTSIIIRSAISKLSSLEPYLGYEVYNKTYSRRKNREYTPVPATDIASILKKYKNIKIPKTFKNTKFDKVVMETLTLLNKVNEDTQESKSQINERMQSLWQNDVRLSQKLDDLLHNFEEEVLANSQKLSQERRAIFENSKNLLMLAFLVALGIIAISSIVIINDFVTSQRYRRKLETANRKSYNLLKNREQLISMVSHDLRTPLSSIVGYSELLSKQKISDKGKNYLSHIKYSSEYISKLVDELLDYTRIEAGKISVEKVPFNTAEIIDEVANNVKSAYKTKEINLTFTFSETVNNLNFSSDAYRVKRILYNLISNAFKFTERGNVHIQADARPLSNDVYEIGIAVTDTGIGIKKEQQQHIFDEFTQANDEISKRYGGSGLGLHISQKLAHLLRGKIYLESNEGKGSTFTLRFLAEKVVERTKAPQIITSNKPANKITIIVIDDDFSILSLIEELLKQKNINAITFNNGRDAFTQMTNHNFDLVITDIQLPEMNGFHFVTLFNEQYKNNPLPVLAITGRRDVPESFYMKSGFSGILPKPFTPEQFYEKLKVFFPKLDTKVEQKTIILTDNATTGGYTPEVLESFMGDDIEGIVNIYQHFLAETDTNLENLKIYVDNKDYKGIKAIAHKMTSMFAQINAKRESEILIYLNKVTNESISDLHSQIHKLEQLFNNECKPAIESYLKKIMQ